MRLEIGSDFHRMAPLSGADRFPEQARFFGAGRYALLALVKYLAVTKKLKRIWLPSYYCDVIYQSIHNHIEVCFYDDFPGKSFDKLAEDFPVGDVTHRDAVVWVNYFGCRRITRHPNICGIQIADQTHAVFQLCDYDDEMDYVFASLRKHFPITDGGVLCGSDTEQISDCKESIQFRNLIDRREAAMVLKSNYLDGKNISKESFLGEFRHTEEEFGLFEEMPISINSREFFQIGLNIQAYEGQRRRNIALLNELLAPYEKMCSLLKTDSGELDSLFACVLCFQTNEIRNKVRQFLIEKNIYPAVFWPVTEVHRRHMSARAALFNECMLSIPCDFRCTVDAMKYIGDVLKKFYDTNYTHK